MKIFLFTITLFAVIICRSFAQDSTKVEAQTGILFLNISGIENNDGNVKIALSDTKEDYTTKGKAYRAVIAPIEKMSAQCTYDSLPFGTYAIKTYHDENENDELDTNFLGIPSEDYGFSNNAKGSFGPASWEDAKFEFNQDSMIVEINFDK